MRGIHNIQGRSIAPPAAGPMMQLNASDFLKRIRKNQGYRLLKDQASAVKEPLYRLKWYNRLVACLAHLGQFIAIVVIGLGASSNARAPYLLTTGRDLVDVPAAGMDLANGVGGCLNGSHYAHQRLLVFRGDGGNVTSLRLTPFVARTGYELSLPWLLASFFLLSFLFQVFSVEPILPGGRHLYYDLADDTSTKTNWYRFAEYSISASVMMLAISLVAGVTDIRVLACVFFLTWGCMVAGILSEILLRLSQLNTQDETRTFWKLAVASHLVGWVLLAVPWAIVITQYNYIFSLCELGKDCAAGLPNPPADPGGFCDGERRVQPPEFVRTIVWVQFLLFICFGGVQAWQLYAKVDKRVEAEWVYITLSLAAKSVLAWLVAVNLLVQE